MTALLAVVLALLLDCRLGEPRRAHPLVAFGRLAGQLEARLNGAAGGACRRLYGALAWLALVAPAVILVAIVDRWLTSSLIAVLFDALLLYLAIGWRSMREHVSRVREALHSGSLDAARRSVGMIVSRDTGDADETQLIAATLETTLENSNDALFATLFWYGVAGVPGVVLHRLANTLDAMWGYRDDRFRAFGCWAARADDVLNFLPSQLLAFTFGLASARPIAWRCAVTQGWRWKSVNAGAVMAAGAAALGLRLGGRAVYQGCSQERDRLGAGKAPGLGDLERAFALVRRALLLWLVAMFILL